MVTAEKADHGRDAAEPVSVAAVHVLVVDDNLANQKLALAMVARLGFTADAVSNGAEAVEVFRNNAKRYAAILMDCQMPVMDGYEATAAIRALERGHPRVPIIALTASAMGGAQERCLAAGMDDYVAKPIVMDELREVLRRWTRSAPQTAEADATAVPATGMPAEVFDAGRVAALRAIDVPGSPDVFKHFATMFLDGAMEQVGALDEALSDGDGERARRAAHTLRGGAATVGAQRLAELCGALEEQVVSGAPGAADTLALIRAELDHVRSSLGRLPSPGDDSDT